MNAEAKQSLRNVRNARQEVRKDILRVANRNLTSQRTLTLKHIQEAIAIVRRRKLVAPEVLVAAGYRAEERRK